MRSFCWTHEPSLRAITHRFNLHSSRSGSVQRIVSALLRHKHYGSVPDHSPEHVGYNLLHYLAFVRKPIWNSFFPHLRMPTPAGRTCARQPPPDREADQACTQDSEFPAIGAP